MSGRQFETNFCKVDRLARLALVAFAGQLAMGQMTADEQKAVVGDAPADRGPLATNLSGAIKPISTGKSYSM